MRVEEVVVDMIEVTTKVTVAAEEEEVDMVVAVDHEVVERNLYLQNHHIPVM